MSDLTSGTTGEVQELSVPELTLTHLDTLPTLAPIALKLLQVTADSDAGARDVVETLRGDQSLTAKVLSVANSPAIGARGKVSTLERAVVLLGFKAVRNIVLAVKVFECLPIDQPSAGQRHFDRIEFWKHSLGAACAARRLAKARRQLEVDPEEAFVAGLLHDLGKVALDAVFPKAYERAAAQAEETRSDLADCERAILGVDHTVAGRHLAKRWGLPRFIQDVIWLHHVSAATLTNSVASARLIALVQLANLFIREQHIGHSGDYAFYVSSAQLAEYLGFAETEIGAISHDVVGEVAEYTSLLGLDRETPETLYLKSLTRANAELGRLNTELMVANRQLTAAARYFRGIAQFDRQLSPSSDLAAVVAAIADVALTVLQRRRLAVFGVHDQFRGTELCCVGSEAQRRESTTQRLTEEMREWLQDPGDLVGATIARAPQPVRSLLASVATGLGEGECWLVPIAHDEKIAGGIVFLSERDERAELAHETEELRSFLAGLGLALGGANAQAAARRLSEDLAESNRRLQQMQAELLRTRTLSKIAEMAGGAGHELNNPLTVISGRAQMLRDAVESPDARRKLQQIHDATRKCSEIVSELMEYARPVAPKPEEVDLGALLTELRDDWLKRSGLPASHFQVDLPEQTEGADRPWIFADRMQIRTMLDEVVKNAVDAISQNDGMIVIQWRAGITLPASPLRPQLPGAPGSQRWVEITVRDTGVGMSPDIAQHVFDPFFSYRPAGRGRGMGLARAHRTVEAHGGRIWVESRLGEGTTFHIRLPQVRDE